MDAIDLTCLLLRTSTFNSLMSLAEYFGHAVGGGIIGLALLAYGFTHGNLRMKRAGLAVFLAMMVAGLAAELLKLGFQLPRPTPRVSYGFPSGHTSAAFGLAATLGVTFPAFSGVFYLCAVLTGIARLYFRASFVWDVVGGAVIGVLAGIPIARRSLTPVHYRNKSLATYIGWVIAIIVALTAIFFFLAIERNINLHLVSGSDTPQTSSAVSSIDFGTPESRVLLRYGWSEDEQWNGGQRTVVWAEGLASEIMVNLASVRDYRFRLVLFPFSPKRPPCQRVEINVNEHFVARLLLEQGWHSYQTIIPKTAVKSGTNYVQFYFDHAESPKSLGVSTDERPLSVAFDRIEVFSGS